MVTDVFLHGLQTITFIKVIDIAMTMPIINTFQVIPAQERILNLFEDFRQGLLDGFSHAFG